MFTEGVTQDQIDSVVVIYKIEIDLDKNKFYKLAKANTGMLEISRFLHDVLEISQSDELDIPVATYEKNHIFLDLLKAGVLNVINGRVHLYDDAIAKRTFKTNYDLRVKNG
jgi:hypothetical protein